MEFQVVDWEDNAPVITQRTYVDSPQEEIRTRIRGLNPKWQKRARIGIVEDPDTTSLVCLADEKLLQDLDARKDVVYEVMSGVVIADFLSKPARAELETQVGGRECQVFYQPKLLSVLGLKSYPIQDTEFSLLRPDAGTDEAEAPASTTSIHKRIEQENEKLELYAHLSEVVKRWDYGKDPQKRPAISLYSDPWVLERDSAGKDLNLFGLVDEDGRIVEGRMEEVRARIPLVWDTLPQELRSKMYTALLPAPICNLDRMERSALLLSEKHGGALEPEWLAASLVPSLNMTVFEERFAYAKYVPEAIRPEDVRKAVADGLSYYGDFMKKQLSIVAAVKESPEFRPMSQKGTHIKKQEVNLITRLEPFDTDSSFNRLLDRVHRCLVTLGRVYLPEDRLYIGPEYFEQRLGPDVRDHFRAVFESLCQEAAGRGREQERVRSLVKDRSHALADSILQKLVGQGIVQEREGAFCPGKNYQTALGYVHGACPVGLGKKWQSVKKDFYMGISVDTFWLGHDAKIVLRNGRNANLLLPLEIETRDKYHLFLLTPQEADGAIRFFDREAQKYDTQFKDVQKSRLRAHSTEYGYVCMMETQQGFEGRLSSPRTAYNRNHVRDIVEGDARKGSDPSRFWYELKQTELGTFLKDLKTGRLAFS